MYIIYIMKRTQIYLGEDQARRLAQRSKANGTTMSELIREAVDAYLDGDDGGGAVRLEHLKQAARDVAGSAPYLPPGKEYVEALRSADAERRRELEGRWRR